MLVEHVSQPKFWYIQFCIWIFLDWDFTILETKSNPIGC